MAAAQLYDIQEPGYAEAIRNNDYVSLDIVAYSPATGRRILNMPTDYIRGIESYSPTCLLTVDMWPINQTNQVSWKFMCVGFLMPMGSRKFRSTAACILSGVPRAMNCSTSTPRTTTLMAVPVTLQPTLRIGVPEVGFHGNTVGANLFVPTRPFGTKYETMYDGGPDGQHFVVVQRGDEVETPTITVVQNWHTVFEDR